MKTVGDLVDLPLNGEGTYIAGTQLSTGQAKTDVSGGEPDLLTWLVLGCISSLGVGLALVSSHSSLEMDVC